MVSAAIPLRRGDVVGFLAGSAVASAAEALWRAHWRPTSSPSAKVRQSMTSTAPPSATHWTGPGPPPIRRRVAEATSVALLGAGHGIRRPHPEQGQAVADNLAHRCAEPEAG